MEILTIENKAGKVRLNDAIFKESVDALLEEIGSVFSAKAVAEGADFGVIMNCAENAADSMEFEIHSPGGSILDGYRIYQAITELRGRGVHVTAFINSLAASMASVIAMAADKVKIVKGGRMMIHEASMGTFGNSADHARGAKLLDEMSDEIAGIYAERTGKKQAEMRERMREETWMSAENAVSEGFADEVVSGKFDTKAEARMNILDRLTSPASAEALAELESLKNAAQAHDGEVTALVGKLEIAENALQEAATATAELRNTLATSEAKLKDAEAIAAKVPTLEADLVAAKASAKAEASRMLAATGLSAALDTEADADAPSDIEARLKAEIDPVKRTLLYRQHKAEILKLKTH